MERMKIEKSELIQEALDTLQAVTLSGRSTESYVAELFENIRDLEKENRNLNEKVRFLEECLDRKEKLNEKYRKELEELKSTYVYDAKQVRDIC